MEEQYAALGRYTAATEVLVLALRIRNRQLQELKRQIDRVVNTGSGGDAPVAFDFAAARQGIDAAQALHEEAEAALADANSVAILARKPPHRWRS